MGILDRVIRTIVGLAIVGLYFANVISGVWAIVLLVLGSANIIASAVGSCPVYPILGFNTCPMKKEPKQTA